MTEPGPIADTNERISFDSRERAHELALALVKQAKKEICFFGASIDPVLFDSVEMVDVLSEFARRHQQTRIRFVVHSTLKNIADSHRLIQLAQRLSSSFYIRISSDQDKNRQQMFLLSDMNGYLYCNHSDSYNGHASLNAPAEVKSLQRNFDSYWAGSLPDVHTRRLHL